MSWLRLQVMGAALLMLAPAVADAADMPGYPALPEPLPPRDEFTPQLVELTSGWYLRGDIGYRFQSVSGASDSVTTYSDTSIHDPVVLGLGAGWKYGWFRADITGDYAWRSEFSGSNGATTVTANIDSFTVMGNAYIDFGTWYGMTPYLGAGIGGAYVTMANYESTPPTGQPAVNYSRWNFAWAAMAGVSFAITHDWLIDVSYRHVEMGDVLGGPSGNELTVDNLRGDEIRIGFRYLLN